MTEKISTSIDELFELVMRNGKIKLNTAARRLGVKKNQVEEWAKILEEHGLIDIHYPPFGEPELRKKTMGKKNV